MPPWRALLGALALAGCWSQHAPPDAAVTPTVTQLITNDLDLLLVIGNEAGGIADKQVQLDSQIGALVQGFSVGLPSLHIGVVNSTVDIGVTGFAEGSAGCPSPDPNDNGLLQDTARTAGCATPNSRFIENVINPDGSRTVDYPIPTGRSRVRKRTSRPR